MKAFHNIEEGRQAIYDLLEKHKDYILRNQTPVDEDVANQKSRFTKFLCWLIYGHIYKNDVCGRCGKLQKKLK